jgi:hypothetical protein
MDSCKPEGSKRQLVSVGIGAHGIIAIGIGAHGIIAIGVSAHGLIAIAVIPMGVISIGVVSMGVFSVGAISMGVITLSSLGMGLYQFPQKQESHQMEMGNQTLPKFPISSNSSLLTTAEHPETSSLVSTPTPSASSVFQQKEIQTSHTCTVAQLEAFSIQNTAVSFFPSPVLGICSVIFSLMGWKLFQRR